MRLNPLSKKSYRKHYDGSREGFLVHIRKFPRELPFAVTEWEERAGLEYIEQSIIDYKHLGLSVMEYYETKRKYKYIKFYVYREYD